MGGRNHWEGNSKLFLGRGERTKENWMNKYWSQRKNNIVEDTRYFKRVNYRWKEAEFINILWDFTICQHHGKSFNTTWTSFYISKDWHYYFKWMHSVVRRVILVRYSEVSCSYIFPTFLCALFSQYQMNLKKKNLNNYHDSNNVLKSIKCFLSILISCPTSMIISFLCMFL